MSQNKLSKTEQADQSRGEILVYQAKDGETKVEVSLRNETVWLTLNQLGDLFDRDKSVISRHLRNIFKAGELACEAVVAKNATTATDGKTYQVEYFNLDAIISVGYRVNSKRGTQFRIWATNVLRDHMIRGSTSWSRTMPLWTAINVLLRPCSSGFWNAMIC
jgi:hypothetical protein